MIVLKTLMLKICPTQFLWNKYIRKMCVHADTLFIMLDILFTMRSDEYSGCGISIKFHSTFFYYYYYSTYVSNNNNPLEDKLKHYKSRSEFVSRLTIDTYKRKM